jgi:hypothetical protein
MYIKTLIILKDIIYVSSSVIWSDFAYLVSFPLLCIFVILLIRSRDLLFCYIFILIFETVNALKLLNSYNRHIHIFHLVLYQNFLEKSLFLITKNCKFLVKTVGKLQPRIENQLCYKSDRVKIIQINVDPQS